MKISLNFLERKKTMANLFNKNATFSMSFDFENKKVTGDINKFLTTNKPVETPYVVSMDQTSPSTFDVTVAVKDDNEAMEIINNLLNVEKEENK